MILQQLDPRARFGSDFNSTAYQSQPVDKCMHAAMDQGFHNWVYYSGQLAKMIDVKVFQQGEGPVNSIGAFAGHRALIKRTLSEWTILRGEAGEKTVHNWNGDRSPVVHQSDRFLSADLAPTLEKHFSFLRKN